MDRFRLVVAEEAPEVEEEVKGKRGRPLGSKNKAEKDTPTKKKAKDTPKKSSPPKKKTSPSLLAVQTAVCPLYLAKLI